LDEGVTVSLRFVQPKSYCWRQRRLEKTMYRMMCGSGLAGREEEEEGGRWKVEL
jgi:hypothetical protein